MAATPPHSTSPVATGEGCCEHDSPSDATVKHTHSRHDHDHGHAHVSGHEQQSYRSAAISLLLLLGGLAMDHLIEVDFFQGGLRVLWYVLAYLIVGWPVLRQAIQSLWCGELFTEFFLMGLATVGAFAIGEYPEGVAVMLFYSIGELFQGAAVQRARGNIRALLDVRPDSALVQRGEEFVSVKPQSVQPGEIIQVRPGEKLPLDGVLLSQKAQLNTAALTGESQPRSYRSGETVLAGSINLQEVVNIRVSKHFADSSIARILELVQHATSRKSKTELLIRRLARVYTPIVVSLALAICLLPYFFLSDYVFKDWLYRALIFLVISCPCALVISIPLGYFGGLGAASRHGILFKGATFLDQLAKIDTLILDKTGTLTQGVFQVQGIFPAGVVSEEELLRILVSLEDKSTHPIAQAIVAHASSVERWPVTQVKEIAGKGLSGVLHGQPVYAGSARLMADAGVELPDRASQSPFTTVFVARDGQYIGHLTIRDVLKADAKEAVARLRQSGIRKLHMLSGDKDSITRAVAAQLGLDSARGDLLPEDKLSELERIREAAGRPVAFVGDGINDAPVLAASDVGIAMGGMGSDVAIETADVVIQTDQPSRIATGQAIGRATQRIIWQNIGLALGVKALVLILGALGMATMWAAVFADVGVALLAILNAIRLQRMRWV